MKSNHVMISEGDKEVIKMTAKLIANKGYNPAEVCTLLLDTVAAEQGTRFVQDPVLYSSKFLSISGRFQCTNRRI
ncbi:hypothetical protein [Alkalicoccobacillus porphyridii]|uniref:Uncharacterized protein n=1 Tax=Alkalicoccobacillus porphyridii TaxID=2597270 RepID=A0A554A0C2_9BACI|nr:hypothetical protein [Alkalicoccobacillus porphyridii]TSB47141.1 hypothetical protein FN960_09025 [Alkalicoccobacillus porphyridii]